MKKRKILLITALTTLAALAIIFFSIPKTPETVDPQYGLVHQSDSVKVLQDPVAETKHYSSAEWVPISEEEVFAQHAIIITGTVLNVYDASVEYDDEWMGRRTETMTLFDFKVEKVLRNVSSTVSIKAGDIIKSGHAHASDSYPEEIPILEPGKQFLLFCMATAEAVPDSPLKYWEYTDCWILGARDFMIEKIGDKYVITEWFAPYISSTGKIYKNNRHVEITAALSTDNTAPDYWRNKYLLETGYAVECKEWEATVADLIKAYDEGGA